MRIDSLGIVYSKHVSPNAMVLSDNVIRSSINIINNIISIEVFDSEIIFFFFYRGIIHCDGGHRGSSDVDVLFSKLKGKP